MIGKIQKAIREAKLDGWLFYDFRGQNPVAHKILELEPDGPRTRRWFYWIPAQGRPIRLVHKIEPECLKSLDGEKLLYDSHLSLDERLKAILKGRKAAMEYSPDIPYISRVDAGTVERVRRAGAKVLSSGDLIQEFEARLTSGELEDHQRTAELLYQFVQEAFLKTKKALLGKRNFRERDLQAFLIRRMERAGLVFNHPPIVAAGPNSGNPHYDPTFKNSLIRPGEILLIDIWAKNKKPGSIYADITWTAFTGKSVPSKCLEVFHAVRQARDKAVEFIQEKLGRGEKIVGWEADRECRQVIARKGYGDYFTHRTGHSIGEEVHGNGANIDSFETKETRRLIPRTLFSIEPGIYLKEFGIRSEIDVFITEKTAKVTTLPLQENLSPILL